MAADALLTIRQAVSSWETDIDMIPFKERLESLYIINCKLQVQKEALYRLGHITVGKYKLQS